MADDIILKVSLDGAQEELNNLTLMQEAINALAKQKKKLNEEQKKLTKAIEDGTLSEKEATDALLDLAEQQVELNLITKQTKNEFRQAERQVISNTKANRANEGSIIQMREEVKTMQKEFLNLSKAERENEKIGGALQKRTDALNDELTELEQSVGINGRAVGNYGDAVKGVLPLMGGFGQQIEGVVRNLGEIKNSVNKFIAVQKANAKSTREAKESGEALSTSQKIRNAVQNKLTASTTAQTIANKKMSLSQKVAAIATGGLSKALKFLKLAFISTGIGALVVALGSVVVFLAKTQKGAEFVSKAMAGIGAVVDVLVDRLAGVGEAISQLFSGDITGAAETFGKATSGVADEIANETKQAIKLKAALIEVEKAENDLILQRAATRAEVKELNKLAEDTTKGYDERSDAARKAIAIEEDLLNKQVDNQKKRAANLLGDFDLTEERLAMLKEEGVKLEDVGINISKEEDRAEAIEEIAKIFQLQQESLELQTTLTNKLNTIEGQRSAERKKEQDEINKRIEKNRKDREKAELELNKAKDKAAENDIKRQEEKEKAIIDNKIKQLELEQQLTLATEELTEEEKFKLALETERKIGALRIEQNQQQANNLIKKEAELQDKLFKLKKESGNKETAETVATQDEINAVKQEKEKVQGEQLTQIKLENQIKEGEILGEDKARQKEEEDEKKAEEDQEELDRLQVIEDGKKEIKNAAIQAGEQFVQEAFNNQNRRIDEGVQREVEALNLKREAGEISAEEFEKKRLALDKKAFEDKKRLSLGQTAIDFAVAAGKTIAQLGFANPALPFALGTLAIEGAAKAAIISSQKFAKGGVIHGASHANGGVQIGSGIEAEGGEAIINKKSTSKHLNLLSAINQDGGGVAFGSPNVGSIGKFANGGITPSVSVQNESVDLTELRETILEAQASIKVTNVASETTGVANRVQQIEDSASF